MVFSTLPHHAIVTVHETPAVVDVEFCVPRPVRLLGLLTLRLTAFSEAKRVPRRRFEEWLRAFLTLPAGELFDYFRAAPEFGQR